MNSCHKRVKLLQVVGEAEGQSLVVIQTKLKDADPRVANPIIDEKFEIQNLRKHIFTGKVVIQGTLVKNIIYKADKDHKEVIAHHTVEEPFVMEVPLPGLKKGLTLGHRTIFPTDLSDIHLQLHLTDIQSSTFLEECTDTSSNPKLVQVNDEEVALVFKKSGLAQKYHGKYPCHCKGSEPPDPQPSHKTKMVHEKVIIKIFVVAAKFVIDNIPVCSTPKVFHCMSENLCKKSSFSCQPC